VGLPVQITVETIPNKTFKGTVKSVANVFNAQTYYSNTDLKLYDTVVTVENTDNTDLLRSGMTCTAEIIIDQFENTVYIPKQAVLSVDGKPTVYMVKGDKLKSRTVELGLDNDSVIRIANGLTAGDILTLTPPFEGAEVMD